MGTENTATPAISSLWKALVHERYPVPSSRVGFRIVMGLCELLGVSLAGNNYLIARRIDDFAAGPVGGVAGLPSLAWLRWHIVVTVFPFLSGSMRPPR